MKIKKTLILILILASSFLGQGVSASTLGLETNNLPDQTMLVTLWLDTQNESVNTIAGSIKFDADLLTCQIGSDAKSLINLWIDRPTVKTGEVSLSGIIPGGFVGQGEIISLVCRGANGLSLGEQEISGLIKIGEDFKVLLNDGLATPAKLKILSTRLAETSLAQDYLSQGQTDKIAPEVFGLEVIKGDDLSGGKSLLVFKSTDKESGVASSAVLESKENLDPKKDLVKIGNLPGWVEINNPYELVDQSRTKYIYLKITDRAGNASISKLSPVGSPYKILLILVIIIMLVSVFLAFNPPKFCKPKT